MAFRELGYGAILVFAHDRCKVDEGRRFPAISLVQEVVFRRGGDEFCAAHDMSDAHQMIIDDVGEVVSRHTVTL